MIWKSLWSFRHQPHYNKVGRRCGPNFLNISESTIRGPVQPGQLGWLILLFVKISMCSNEKPGWLGYRNRYNEKSWEARSRKPSQLGWPGSYEEPPKQPERWRAPKLHHLYNPWGGENKLSHCYIPPSSLWCQYLAHSIFPLKGSLYHDNPG